MIRIIKEIRSKFFSLITKENIPFYTRDIFKSRKFVVGKYTYGSPNVIFENSESNLYIGNFCSIAGGVTIFLGGNHRTDWITTFPFSSFQDKFPQSNNIKGHPSTKGDVVIGNDVWIGLNAVIMSGVTIGNGAVVATSSVVTKNIGPYEIWGGNPSILIGKRFDEEKIELLEKEQWWNWEEDKILSNTEVLCSTNFNNFSNLLQNR